MSGSCKLRCTTFRGAQAPWFPQLYQWQLWINTVCSLWVRGESSPNNSSIFYNNDTCGMSTVHVNMYCMMGMDLQTCQTTPTMASTKIPRGYQRDQHGEKLLLELQPYMCRRVVHVFAQYSIYMQQVSGQWAMCAMLAYTFLRCLLYMPLAMYKQRYVAAACSTASAGAAYQQTPHNRNGQRRTAQSLRLSAQVAHAVMQLQTLEAHTVASSIPRCLRALS